MRKKKFNLKRLLLGILLTIGSVIGLYFGIKITTEEINYFKQDYLECGYMQECEQDSLGRKIK